MSIINDGAISIIIQIILSILIITDWFSSTIFELGVKKRVVLYIMAGLLMIFISFPLRSNWEINLGGFVLPIIGYLFILFKRVSSKDKIQVLTATLLLASSYFLLKELILLEPIILFMKESYQISILLSILVILIASKQVHRFALILGGITFGEFIFNFRHQELLYRVVVGDGEARDVLWISLLIVLILDNLIIDVKNWFKKKSKLTITLRIR
ncbi:hypothetical protein BHF71_03890 [Vulcanibacillus modesticaldus]|uniref:Uncharacterized protein n=1 Tax=Vulcanibacillus modesticaldus TaxID=337097 RepID=A0A1D2YSI2_9BACI|nr:hypothetical protein [Vulcanibacillus modesticaldus]OEF97285.1 hypothetical protein BHF71_03890 [Vulcanibacillus modesticaldus]